MPQENHTNGMYHGVVGRSPAMQKIFNLIERIKDSSVNVLITGPSGSGKELVAHALHETSPRAHLKFVAINCSAIPDTLLEAELFGYKKGAFTDAHADKVGLFYEADKGTIFLDEIGDMPLSVQPKILRAIQEREIRALGDTLCVAVDVRIITATNQNLPEKISQKLFREDLYYRLNAMQIELPPLKDRREDIPLLVCHFLDLFQKAHDHSIKEMSPQAVKMMCDYPWPGNVRELQNVIERAVLLSKGELIEPSDLFFPAQKGGSAIQTGGSFGKRRLEDVEKDYILDTLNSADGNRSETARILGIGRKTLYNKLAKYGM